MGLYDELEGIQVKCFFKNYYAINYSRTNENKSGVIYCSGSLKYYDIGDEIPYKSYHYDYGPNFILFDYLSYTYDSTFNIENLDIIEIKDGKLFSVCSLGEFLDSTDYEELPLVLDFGGSVLNVHTPNDLKEIAYNWRDSLNQMHKVQDRALKEKGLSMRLLNPKSFEESSLSKEMSYLGYLGEYNLALDLGYTYLDNFRSYWIDKNKGISLDMIAPTDWGSLYQTLIDLNVSKEEKQKLCKLFKEDLKYKGIDWLSNLKEYLCWCEYHGVDVDKNLIISYM